MNNVKMHVWAQLLPVTLIHMKLCEAHSVLLMRTLLQPQLLLKTSNKTKKIQKHTVLVRVHRLALKHSICMCTLCIVLFIV